MTDLFEKPPATAQGCSAKMQDKVARESTGFVGDDETAFRFTLEEAVELDEAERAALRGDYATDVQIRTIWAKHGL